MNRITQRIFGTKLWAMRHKILATIMMIAVIGGTAGGISYALFVNSQHSGLGVQTNHPGSNGQYVMYVNGTSLMNNGQSLNFGTHSYTSANFSKYSNMVAQNSTFQLGKVSGFTDGGYFLVNITIQDTGTAPIYINTSLDQFGVANYFVNNTTGKYMPAPNSIQDPTGGEQFGNGTAGSYVYYNASQMIGTQTLSDYLGYLDTNSQWNYNWVNDWSMPTIPTVLHAGQIWTFQLYVGLGANAPSDLPSQFFGLQVPVSIQPLPN